ncbi:hypothetical protein SARC_02034 [Sphaeroforma arctica JP610]|uniref:Uncharacterized protein n=1 Tax=Sphaeroforma arctica JP610 TaxID=667725 RepID=A0A0L0G9Y1_9EUKA|nr:hypothetical protein SARC_02034 [Sphaeroforma arctica JP610]KNC85810.1 hypothetical protein SARC_02034 [Sphaeroforma arctica JP610]|eukprot:XP_014159712.1 hypothetical protein SARC_02034 [Sphaeroforma arctica JP610]
MSEPNQSLLNTRPTAWSGVRPLLLTKKNASDTSLSRNTHTKATSLAENTHIDHLPKRGDRAATADPRSNVEGDTELDSVVLYVDDEASAKEACVLIEEASILAYDAEYVVIRSTPAVTPATAAGVGGNGVVEAMTTGKARDGDDTRDKAMHTRVNATDGTDTPETTAANMVASKVTYIASSNADGVSNRRHVIGDAAAAGVALSTGGCTDTCDNCPSSKPATLQIAAWNGAHARMHLVVIDMLTYSLAIEDGHANTLTVQTDADGECESGIDDRRLNNSALSEDALAADEAVAVEHNKAYGTVCAHDTDKTRQTTNPRSRGGGAGSEASGERRGSITHGGETVQRLAAVLRRKHMDTSVLKLGFSFGQVCGYNVVNNCRKSFFVS